MGMAASQARYLALTARKTNTEWEGQQINQARTALSNQSAGLFNRLLAMEVPNAPKTTDYTKIQYSYSDGDNESVFEDWHQINVSDPNYNYVVSHYYMADVFTGIKRLLQDPQVQIGDVLQKVEYNTKTTGVTRSDLNHINVNYKINNYGYDQQYEKITPAKIKNDKELKTALTKFESSTGLLRSDGSLSTDGIYGYQDDSNIWHFFVAYNYDKVNPQDVDVKTASDLKKSLEIYESDNDLYTSDPELTYDGIYKTQDADGNWNFINISDYTQLNKASVESGASDLRQALYEFEKENNLLNEYTTLRYNSVYGKQDADGNWSFINTVGYKPLTRSEVNSSTELKNSLYEYEKENGLINLTYGTIYGKEDINNNWDFVNIAGLDPISEEVVDARGDYFRNSLTDFETENNLLNDDGSLSYDNIYYTQRPDGTWEFKHTVGYTQLTEEIVDQDTGTLKNALTDYEYNTNLASISVDNVYGHQKEDGTWEFTNTTGYTAMTEEAVNSSEALKAAITDYETNENLLIPHEELTYNNIYATKDADGNWNFITLNDYTKVRQSDIDTTAQEKLASTLNDYEVEHGIINPGEELVFDNIYGKTDDDGNWDIVDTIGYHSLTEAEVEAEGAEALKAALTQYETDNNLLNEDGSLNYDNIFGEVDDEGNWSFVSTKGYDAITAADIDESTAIAIKKSLTDFEIANNLLVKEPGLRYDGIYSYTNDDGSYGFINTDDYLTLSKDVVDAQDDLKRALIQYETEHDLFDDKGNLVYDGIYASQDSEGNWSFINTNDKTEYTKMSKEILDTTSNESLLEALTRYETQHNLLNEDGSLSYDHIFTHLDEDNNWQFYVNKQCEDESFMLPKDYTDYSTVYGPSYVGNSKLTELNELLVDRASGTDQVTDLAQILRDNPDSSLNKYLSFDDAGNLQYEGYGIYTFDLLGKTYYTSYDDLIDSAEKERKKAINLIDDQVKMAYYSASYVPTKIEETNNALLETGENGRFKSVKFDNDSVVYNLNVEEVTDDAAYESAMNDYMYKKAQYEKTIADINAKTSMIQQEDRTLELRLKQLDTEQNALATEMDAVKKVIKDNVEKTFKTFSD